MIKSSLQEVSKRSDKISEPNDFLTSESGVILLDSICMKLSAVGESFKNLDKITNHELLPKYSKIPVKPLSELMKAMLSPSFQRKQEL